MNDDAPVSPGERLRRAREQAGWSVERVALKLHLSVAQVTALEKGERERLPPAPYVRGYLRSYAQLLGLDPQDFVNARGGQERTPVVMPNPMTATHKRPVGLFSYLLFVLGIVVAVAWWHASESPHAQATPGVAAMPARQAVGSLPPRLQSLATPGKSNGQLSEFPLDRPVAPLDLAQDGAVLPGNTKPVAAIPTQRPRARLLTRPTPTRTAHRVAKKSTRPAARKAPLVRHRLTARSAPPAHAAAAVRRAVAGAHRSPTVPSAGGLVSLPQGHRYVGLRISASMVPIQVSVRDASGANLLSAEILAGQSVRVMGRPPFHLALNQTQGVAVKVAGHAVALPPAQKGQGVRITIDQ
ncbi:MAG TPA: RodZ domain-containing protein [Acidiferrobacter sp.]|nr:RodZ domain-containing protein [Acidiferrobacter sp.]